MYIYTYIWWVGTKIQLNQLVFQGSTCNCWGVQAWIICLTSFSPSQFDLRRCFQFLGNSTIPWTSSKINHFTSYGHFVPVISPATRRLSWFRYVEQIIKPLNLHRGIDWAGCSTPNHTCPVGGVQRFFSKILQPQTWCPDSFPFWLQLHGFFSNEFQQ